MNKLIRNYLKNGAYGEIFIGGESFCCTVEKPYRSNEPFNSCVPPGVYELVDFKSERYGNTYALKNHNLGVGVNKGDSIRWACLFHPANFPEDVDGCVGPGEDLHPQRWGVSSSRVATGRLLEKLAEIKENSQGPLMIEII